MMTLWQDVKYGWRMLSKSPGFAAIAILTLALGIGANTAIFSLTDQVLLRNLPVPHPDQLVDLVAPGPSPGRNWSDGVQGASFSYPMYQDMRAKMANAFAGLLATFPIAVDISGQGASQRGAGELVSGNYFQVLGVTPALGRVFSMDDETAPGANPVAVLSYGFWAEHFGRDPNILDKALTVNGTSLTIVGVAREGYAGIQIGGVPDLFVPITMKQQMDPNSKDLLDRKSHWVQILGRLNPGFTPDRAQAAVAPAFYALLESEVPLYKFRPEDAKKFTGKKLLLQPGSQGRPIVQLSARGPLLTLMTMVSLVLLIACANLASLLAARGESRQREIAVRLALGAGRWRLVRQLLTEGLMLALAGGALGLFFAQWTLNTLVSSIASGEQILGLNAQLDNQMLLFALTASVLSALLFSLAPAFRSTRVDLHTTLKEQGTSVTGSTGNVRMRQGLIVAQVALTAVLLAASGLFVKSLMHLDTARLGVRTDHVLQFSIEPGLDRYSPAQTTQLFDRLRESLAQLPGVRSVGVAMIPIFQGDDSDSNITAEGYAAKPDENTDCMENYISPGYFSAMGIPLLSGREFTDADAPGSPKVVIINEKLAQRFFSGRNPIGLHIAIGAGSSVHPDIEIVGVVADSKHDDVRDPISPFMYFPYAQGQVSGPIGPLGFGTFYLHTAQDPTALVSGVRQTLQNLGAQMPVYDLRTLSEQVDDSMFADRLVTFLSLGLGLLAVLLAAIGLYGVMAHVVARRTHEIGIRMALGAQRGDVMRLILGQGARLAVVGIVIGMGAAFGLARLLSSLLYGVSPSDLATFLAVPFLLALIAFAACYIPARRAMRVDPMVALRYE